MSDSLSDYQRYLGTSAEASPPWASVQRAPHLPMAVFTSTERWHAERIGALALYCSDGRWGDAFDEFCHRCLHIPRYDRFAVPGGPAWLVPREANSSNFYQEAREQLDFLVRVHELERMVLIAHYGCAFYAELLGQGPDDCLSMQFEDVARAADALRDWYPRLSVEAYLAMRTGNCLSFHGVT